jgi:surfactin synthase thioesterase subunit/acyl carrier protein
METAIASASPLSLIADIDWNMFRFFIDFSLQPSLFKQITVNNKTGNPATESTSSLILSSPPDKAKALIEEIVRKKLRMVMLIESIDTIDATQRFNFLGMDSLMAITFVAKLEQHFNCKLPATLVYNYPTIGAARDFIFDLLYTDHDIADTEQRPEVASSDVIAADIAESQKSFLLVKEKSVSPKIRLFCFPYAGSGASVYTRWADVFGEQVEVVAIQPPGREERSNEKAFTSLTDIISELLNDFREEEGAFYFFGHSLGALMAYEFYVALKREGRKLPVKLFLSGCAAPLATVAGKVHLLPDDEFIAEVLRNYSGDVNIDKRRDALNYNMDLLRADIKVLECYESGQEVINVPMTVISGLKDTLATQQEVKKWMQLSESDFSIFYLNGGHDLINDHADDLIHIIRSGINIQTY